MTREPLPCVSIIIPCFRQAHFLSQAIDCALEQSYPHVQVVVVNDGSDDNTEEVAGRYGRRISYVAKANGGLPSARNAGIRTAEGDYLLFLDADDLLHRKAVEWLVDSTQQLHDCLCVMGSSRCANPLTPSGAEESVRYLHTVADTTLLHENLAPCNAYLCSREMVLQVGLFEESLRSCEDWDLWLRLVFAGARLVLVPKVGAFYRDTPGSLSKNLPRMLQTRTEVLLRTFDAIVHQPELLAHWGADLLEACHRVRRRWIAQRRGPECVAQLTTRIRALRRKGFGRRQSIPKRMVDRLLGECRAERMALTFFRWFEPTTYRYYQAGYN